MIEQWVRETETGDRAELEDLPEDLPVLERGRRDRRELPRAPSARATRSASSRGCASARRNPTSSSSTTTCCAPTRRCARARTARSSRPAATPCWTRRTSSRTSRRSTSASRSATTASRSSRATSSGSSAWAPAARRPRVPCRWRSTGFAIDARAFFTALLAQPGGRRAHRRTGGNRRAGPDHAGIARRSRRGGRRPGRRARHRSRRRIALGAGRRPAGSAALRGPASAWRARRRAARQTPVPAAGRRSGLRLLPRVSRRGVFLRASPIDVSAIVRELLLDRMQATVLTSATLTVDGSFDYVRGRLGVAPPHPARTLRLPSEFDYARQAILYLPRRMPDPRSPEFAEAAGREVVEILRRTEGGRSCCSPATRCCGPCSPWWSGSCPIRFSCRGRRRDRRCCGSSGRRRTPCCSRRRASGRAST